MKVSAQNVDAFIRSLDPGVRAVLVYGPDAGLVRERASAAGRNIVADNDDPFGFAELSSSSLNKDPVRLVDEVLAVPFGGGRRVVMVQDGGDDLVGALTTVLENAAAQDPLAALVVVTAGNLTPRSALRRLFESTETFAALPCYPDDEAALVSLVRTSLGDEGIGIDRAALHAAAALLGSDRQANRRELEKLILFAGPDGHVSEEMVVTCLGDSAAASAEEAVLSAADGNYDGLVEHLARVWHDGTEPVAVIRSAQRHFQRLHFVMSLARDGVPLEGALKQLRPPVFWRVAARFRAQSSAWSLAAVEASLARLTEAELSAKSTGTPAALVCDRALLAIAQLARNPGRAG